MAGAGDKENRKGADQDRPAVPHNNCLTARPKYRNFKNRQPRHVATALWAVPKREQRRAGRAGTSHSDVATNISGHRKCLYSSRRIRN